MTSADARSRLVTAAIELVDDDQSAPPSLEALAERAGLSRATAYRHFGDRAGMITEVVIHRAADYVRRCHELLADLHELDETLHAAFGYLVPTLAADPWARWLADADPPYEESAATRTLAYEAIGPEIEALRQAGKVRVDLSLEEIVDWLVEQLYGAVRMRMAPGAQRRTIDAFLVPALRPSAPGGEMSAVLRRIEGKIDRVLRDNEAESS